MSLARARYRKYLYGSVNRGRDEAPAEPLGEGRSWNETAVVGRGESREARPRSLVQPGPRCQSTRVARRIARRLSRSNATPRIHASGVISLSHGAEPVVALPRNRVLHICIPQPLYLVYFSMRTMLLDRDGDDYGECGTRNQCRTLAGKTASAEWEEAPKPGPGDSRNREWSSPADRWTLSTGLTGGTGGMLAVDVETWAPSLSRPDGSPVCGDPARGRRAIRSKLRVPGISASPPPRSVAYKIRFIGSTFSDFYVLNNCLVIGDDEKIENPNRCRAPNAIPPSIAKLFKVNSGHQLARFISRSIVRSLTASRRALSGMIFEFAEESAI